jgi:hypothetical protein
MSAGKRIEHPVVQALLASIVALFVSLGGCGKDGKLTVIPEPDPTIDSLMCVEDGGQPIGPSGGTVTFSSEHFGIPELEMEFEPGGIDYFMCFHPGVCQAGFAIYYPAGFDHHLNWCCLDLGQWREEHYQSLMMHMAIPVDGISFDPDSTEILCAFHYDTARATWAISPPVDIDDSNGMMTVVTPFKRYWNWGTVRLDEADYDATLKPFMAGIAGEEEISDAEQYIANFVQNLVEQDWDATCTSVFILRGAFEDLRDEKVANLQDFQDELDNLCGPCHVSSTEFFTDAMRYIGLHARIFFLDWWSDPDYVPFILKAIFILGIYDAYSDLASMCDYGCLLGVINESYPGFWRDIFGFYLGTLGVDLIDLAIELDYIDC